MSPAAPAKPVIAQQFGAAAGEALRQRLPAYEVLDVAPGVTTVGACSFAGLSVLLAGPSRSWVGAHRPAGWPFSLQWIQLPGAGWDDYPAWLFEVPCVTSAPALNTNAIAEYCLAAMLAHEKSHRDLWLTSAAEWRTRHLGSLEGKTLALAGLGAIGQRVAQMAVALGMRVVAARRDTSRQHEGVEIVGSIAELAPLADHLVLCLPYADELHHVIDSEFFSRCRAGLHIINVARGGLIDQHALLSAVRGGTIAAATLDVTDPEPLPDDHPLYTTPAVRVSPHIAWSNPRTLDRLISYFGEQLERFASGQAPANVIYSPIPGSKETKL